MSEHLTLMQGVHVQGVNHLAMKKMAKKKGKKTAKKKGKKSAKKK